jgi:hypothetical protein
VSGSYEIASPALGKQLSHAGSPAGVFLTAK